jgi:hypothetical protein
MSTQPARLTLAAYLDGWDPATGRLTVNILVIPVGDPFAPLSQGWPGVPPSPPFAGATLDLVAHLGTDPTQLPTIASVPVRPGSFTLPAPPDQAAILKHMVESYDVTAAQDAPVRSGRATLKKYLPASYRGAFGFVAPSTALAVTDDSYLCARRCPPEAQPVATPWEAKVSWGDVFAMLLRQPAVARAAGLVHSVTLDVGTTLSAGGWLFFRLAPGGSFASQAAASAGFARSFATRIPALAGRRPVFTAVLFPVAADAAAAAAFGPLDTVYSEAVAYDDGFARIVHASQSRSADLGEDGDDPAAPPPQRDEGVRLGWDDESIVERLDRGLSATAPDGTPLPDAPTGAAGYRVDVRRQGAAAWTSLNLIESPGLAVGEARLPGFRSELLVEVHPSQLGTQFWVPPWYARWRGGSLVAETRDERDVLEPEADFDPPYLPLNAEAVPLRYGQSYEFRVRLADITGGGPKPDDAPIHVGDAPVAPIAFRRFVPPGALGITALGAMPKDGFALNRPGIAWPQAAFAGAPDALARLAKKARANRLTGVVRPLAVPDPDATHVELRVLVLHPRFDPLADDAGYVELYRTTRAFPPLGADGEETGSLNIGFDWVDCARLSDVAWPDPGAPLGSLDGPLPLPTARAVRVEARAVGREDAAYFGDPQARLGQVALLTPTPILRDAMSEASPFFRPVQPASALATILLRPDPVTENASEASVMQRRPSVVLATRLAGAAGLVEDEAVLLDAPGQRTLFACAGLKHVLAPDLSSLQLTSLGELPGRWIGVLRLEVERDWSWLGYQDGCFVVTRTVMLVGTGEVRQRHLGVIGIQNTVGQQAIRGTIDRDRFGLCVVDAFEPMLGADGLPHELEVRYEVRARLRTGPEQVFAVQTRLPVATPPRQVPRVVATGHAFSDYDVIGDYEETATRQRVLWIEMAEPLADPRDAYFARLLHGTTDPLLMPAAEPMADPPAYDKPPLDPELVRVIRPGQVRDQAGLGIAQRLVPCATPPGVAPRHFLLPIPPTLTPHSPELFGFFTYELTVGHDAPLWVTAQGRFGPALVLEGVQHPAPPLHLDIRRDRPNQRIALSAGFARAVRDGRDLGPLQPTTELWIVAYARLRQADGLAWRNVKLGQRRAAPLRTKRARASNLAGGVVGQGSWTRDELRGRLEMYGLPDTTPLTFLAVELLPEPNGRFADPVAGDLGEVRILRTSRLISAGDACCG